MNENSLRFFQKANRQVPRQVRNPITQEGIRDQEIDVVSKGNPRGPGKGSFSGIAQGSFKLAYEPKDCKSVSPMKKFECRPVNRNPILLEGEKLPPRPSPEKFSRFTNSSIFTANTPEPRAYRERIHDKHLKSSVFDKNSEIPVQKAQIRKKEQKNTEVGSLLVHYDGAKEHNIAVKPNNARVNSVEIQKNKKDLVNQAKVYHARRNNSEIFFS